jgi:hypothetical protein
VPFVMPVSDGFCDDFAMFRAGNNEQLSIA